MQRGEIWLVGLDPAEGHERKGPVLIVSPEAFNRATRAPVVLPITSGGNFAPMAGFTVPLTGAGPTRQALSDATSRGRSTLASATPQSWKRFPRRSRTKCWRA